MHLNFALLLPLGWFALMIIGGLIGAFGKSGGSYLCRLTQSEIMFRKPPALHLAVAVLGIGLMLGLPVILVSAVLDHQAIGAAAWGMSIPLILMAGGLGAMMLRLAGPDELRLDRDARTYSWTTGWPFLPRKLTGPWLHFWGVYVGEGGGSSSVYFVGLRSGVIRGKLFLGRFGRLPAAEQFADEVAALLDMPRVPPPTSLFDPQKRRKQPDDRNRSSRSVSDRVKET